MFMFGDYEFLSSMYGISGAAGRHPCLWCLITSEEMQLSKFIRRFNMPCKRTLDSLKLHYTEFVEKCDRKLSLAKTVFNMMDNIFFEIPLDRVCLPGLHITMGIFLKIFNQIIEHSCADLDHSINHDNCFYKKCKLKNELTDLEERRELIQNEINWYEVLHDNNDLVNEYQLHLDQVEGEVVEKENLLEMEKGIAAAGDDLGPCVKSLDKTLAAIGVERQAYYSNTITGNHCHVLLKPENIDKLCDYPNGSAARSW